MPNQTESYTMKLERLLREAHEREQFLLEELGRVVRVVAEFKRVLRELVVLQQEQS
jgi:hypothetical protein